MGVDLMLSDLLRVAAMGLFLGATYFVKELAAEVKEIRRIVSDHGERIATIEGARQREMNGLSPR